MPRFYKVRFYSDIARHDKDGPCEMHSRAYPSQTEAETAANSAMALMRGKYGARVGYLVADRNDEPVAVGPQAFEGGLERRLAVPFE